MTSVDCDVLVCGGGIAGCAAALQAAREGCKTILVEKTVFPGGLATSGLVYIYLPLCDGYGKQILFGIAEELLHASIKYGPGRVPAGWNADSSPKPFTERYMTKFSPASFILSLDEKLEEAGVDIWYDTLLCSAETEDGKIRAAEVENKSGRIRIRAKCFIDATGDSDLARRAGAECMSGTNILSQWSLEYDGAAPADWHNLADPIARVVYNEPVEDPEEFRGISGKQVSSFLKQTRRLLLQRYRKMQNDGSHDRNTLFPLLLPVQADFRTTFFIRGKTVLTPEQYHCRFEDSVGLINDWTKPAEPAELPYSSLLPEKLRGLLAAGRCISVQGEAVERVRVIPVAAMTGQTAGFAASIAVKKQLLPDEVPIGLLQEKLKSAGYLLHR